MTGGQAFSITEAETAGYELESASCEPLSGGSSGGSLSGNTLTFTPASGEEYICTFTNAPKQEGTITIKKEIDPGNSTEEFDFTTDFASGFSLGDGETQTFSVALNNTYVITEALEGEFELTEIACTPSSGEVNFVSTPETGQVSITFTDKATGGALITCTFTNFKENDEDMEEEVEKFNEVVLDHLLTHEPDRARLIRRLDREEPVSLKDTTSLPPLKMNGSMTAEGMKSSFSMSLSGLRASMMAEDAKKIREAKEGGGVKSSFANDPYLAPYMMTRPGWDLWIEGQVTRYSDDEGGRDRDGTFSILYLGADYALAPGVIVGALVQIDHTDHEIDSSDVWGKIEGTGWMAGPYMGAKLSENLLFDARAAWGQSSNDVELDSDDSEFRTGAFDMERWLVSAKLTGLYHYGNWRISPQLGVIWGTQDQDAFQNSLGQAVRSSSVSLGRVTFGPEFGYTTTLEDGSTLQPHVKIEGIWQFDGHEIDFGDTTVKTDDLRARVEGGVIYATPEGYILRAAGSYDGLGDEDFEAWSAKAWLNVPLD